MASCIALCIPQGQRLGLVIRPARIKPAMLAGLSTSCRYYRSISSHDATGHHGMQPTAEGVLVVSGPLPMSQRQ